MRSLSSAEFRGHLGPEHKSVPPGFWGRPAESVHGARLTEFLTPLLTLNRGAMEHNMSVFHAWCGRLGLEVAPHGKTTMAPELWRRQLEAGAWGITVATPWQAMIAEEVGVPRILIANEVVDEISLAWIAAASAQIACWVDSLDGVERMNSFLSRGGHTPVDVIVERGAVGVRTGARTAAEFFAIAQAVKASPHLRLVGAAGFEGAIGSGRAPSTLGRIEGFITDLADAASSIQDLIEVDHPIVSAGGSAYVDLVAHGLRGLRDTGWTVIVRSGAYVVHDDGLYRDHGPIGRSSSHVLDSSLPLQPALHVWARVISRPERGLALLDAGRRDLPFDERMPEPQSVLDRVLDAAELPLHGATITGVNDQHSFMRIDPESDLRVGEIVKLGISHPCTAFDKWRLTSIPLS